MADSTDPTVVRSIAVTVDDVLSAFEANRQRDAGAVLRVTPPFNGRMRARIHVAREGEYADGRPRPLHVDPAALLTDAAVAAYPHPDDTEDELRADSDETYTPERHHEYHRERVAAWRADARDAIVDTVPVETPAGPHTVTVKTLG